MTRAHLGEDELRAWYSFLQAHHQVVRALDVELVGEHALPLASYEVLLWLSQSPGRSMKMADLARVVLLSPSGLTRLVDRMAAAGLVERRPSGGDGRVMLAHLTDKGLDRFGRAAASHVRGIKEHFTGRLSPAQLRALTAILETVSGPAECPKPPRAGRDGQRGERPARVSRARLRPATAL